MLLILALVAAIVGVSVVGLRGRGLPPGRYLLALHPASDRVRALIAVSEPGTTPRVLADNVTAYSPEPRGSRVAYVDNRGALWVLDAATGERPPRPTVVCPTRCADPAWRPGTGDGGRSRIAFRAESSDDEGDNLSGGRLWWVDPATPSEAAPIFTDPNLRGREPRWSPDGVRLAYTDSDTGETVVYDFSRPRGAAFARHGFVPRPMAWSPDGETLLFPGEYGLEQVRAMGGRRREVVQTMLSINALAWKPDGSQFVIARTYYEINHPDESWIDWRDAGRRSLADTIESGYRVRALAWSSDSAYLAAERVASTGDERLDLNALPAIWTLYMEQPPVLWLENATDPDWLVWE